MVTSSFIYVNTIMGIKCLICDLAMYREDINNCPGRFQKVVDELIKELDC